MDDNSVNSDQLWIALFFNRGQILEKKMLIRTIALSLFFKVHAQLLSFLLGTSSIITRTPYYFIALASIEG